MLTPTEYESGMTDADSKVYTVNMESDKAARKAFAADALQYAQENGIEPTETRTAQDGERDVAFLGLNLGIHVVDTAGRARVVVMWDMGWESEITESYEPEADTGTETAAAGTESTAENSAESAEKAMIQAAAGVAPEESGATEDGADAEKESMESTEPESAEEAAEENSSAPVVIIMAAVAVLAVAAGIVYMKRKR